MSSLKLLLSSGASLCARASLLNLHKIGTMQSTLNSKDGSQVTHKQAAVSQGTISSSSMAAGVLSRASSKHAKRPPFNKTRHTTPCVGARPHCAQPCLAERTYRPGNALLQTVVHSTITRQPRYAQPHSHIHTDTQYTTHRHTHTHTHTQNHRGTHTGTHKTATHTHRHTHKTAHRHTHTATHGDAARWPV